MNRSWVLVGMMGAGKSAVGRSLAALADRPFADTDQLLQNKLGQSISRLFAVYGEEAFRDHESALIRGLEPDRRVLATGGGIVLRPENWCELRRLGPIIYLRAELATLAKRLEASKKKRPLLEVENWEGRLEDLLERRKPLYEQADLHFDVDADHIEETAARLLAEIRTRGWDT